MDEDLAAFFADFGVQASANGMTACVLLDMPGQSLLGDMQISTDYAITYASADLPGLKHGSSITVSGSAYTVREITLQDDGQISRASLKR